jgi:DNA-binding GntR family transcriptional regulator
LEDQVSETQSEPTVGRRIAGRRDSPYEKLKQAILSGELNSGEALVETALAEWCQVSRTPIREALMRLEQDGLVHRTDRGLAVRERTPEEVLDIYETRIVLEATAAGLASERRSMIDLMTLRRAAERFDSSTGVDDSTMMDVNRQFHHTLWKATHNESLIDLLSRLDLHLARYPATTLSQPGRWEEAGREHREIIDAIEARDRALSEKLATKHFARARDLRLASWDSDGQPT